MTAADADCLAAAPPASQPALTGLSAAPDHDELRAEIESGILRLFLADVRRERRNEKRREVLSRNPAPIITTTDGQQCLNPYHPKVAAFLAKQEERHAQESARTATANAKTMERRSPSGRRPPPRDPADQADIDLIGALPPKVQHRILVSSMERCKFSDAVDEETFGDTNPLTYDISANDAVRRIPRLFGRSRSQKPLKDALKSTVAILRQYVTHDAINRINWTDKQVRTQATKDARQWQTIVSDIKDVIGIIAERDYHILETEFWGAKDAAGPLCDTDSEEEMESALDAYLNTLTDAERATFIYDPEDGIRYVRDQYVAAPDFEIIDAPFTDEALEQAARIANRHKMPSAEPKDILTALFDMIADEHATMAPKKPRKAAAIHPFTTARGGEITTEELTDPETGKRLENSRGNLLHGGKTKRLCDSMRYHRRKLRAEINPCDLHISSILGMIGADREVFAPDHLVSRHIQQKAANDRMLRKHTIIGEDGKPVLTKEGQIVTVADIVKSKLEVSDAITSFTLDAMQGLADAEGLSARMYTITLPAEWHSRAKDDKNRKTKYDPTYSPKAGVQRIAEGWSRVRARMSKTDPMPLGTGSPEAHHDGTPHRHIVVWTDARRHAELLVYVAEEFLPEQGLNDHWARIMERTGPIGLIGEQRDFAREWLGKTGLVPPGDDASEEAQRQYLTEEWRAEMLVYLTRLTPEQQDQALTDKLLASLTREFGDSPALSVVETKNGAAYAVKYQRKELRAEKSTPTEITPEDDDDHLTVDRHVRHRAWKSAVGTRGISNTGLVRGYKSTLEQVLGLHRAQKAAIADGKPRTPPNDQMREVFALLDKAESLREQRESIRFRNIKSDDAKTQEENEKKRIAWLAVKATEQGICAQVFRTLKLVLAERDSTEPRYFPLTEERINGYDEEIRKNIGLVYGTTTKTREWTGKRRQVTVKRKLEDGSVIYKETTRRVYKTRTIVNAIWSIKTAKDWKLQNIDEWHQRDEIRRIDEFLALDAIRRITGTVSVSVSGIIGVPRASASAPESQPEIEGDEGDDIWSWDDGTLSDDEFRQLCLQKVAEKQTKAPPPPNNDSHALTESAA